MSPHKHPKGRDHHRVAVDAIKKKLVGKTLSYEEIYAVMDEISQKRLGPVLTTYFAAAGFREGFTRTELYHLTHAMVETGPKLSFRGIVANKHSIGGVAGTRTSMILVPLVAACGFKIPKTSTRAITSPSGTADTMEVLSPVTFSPVQIERIVEKVGGCIVWGGSLGLAPGDDELIKVEKAIAFESYDKFIVSIIAKKVAIGATHLVLDVPVGRNMKVHHMKDAEMIADKFHFLADKFGIKTEVDINKTRESAGRGIGPVLEAKDVLQVLEQQPGRSHALEDRTVRLAGKLLSLCYAGRADMKRVDMQAHAREVLQSGRAHEAFQAIVKAQGGDPHIDSAAIRLGRYKYEVPSPRKGAIRELHNKQISSICRILGCPGDKRAGMYLDRKMGEKVDKGDILCTLYSSDSYRLKEARETLASLPIYTVV